MKPLVIDIEGSLNGHPFNPDHRMHLVGVFDGNEYRFYDIEHSGKPYGESLRKLQADINNADLLVAFNAKYDLHWLRRYGIRFNSHKLWCCQYSEFAISGQTWPYPDLDTAAKNRGLEGKSDYIKETYWSKGIDTPSIPWQELVDYNAIDLKQTYDLFERQKEYLQDKEQLKKLIWWGCQDLLVTEEMEFNGIKYDFEKSQKRGDDLLAEASSIQQHLNALVGRDDVLWSSPTQLSAVLYGGVVKTEAVEPFTFTYKDGRTREKVRKVQRDITFPRIVEPLRGSNTAREGVFSTDEGTLRKLKAYGKAKQIIEALLKKREIEKKVGTYYHGFINLAKEFNWEDNLLHGQLNHCRAASGRLSSIKPNQQNLEKGMRECVVTRFNLKDSSIGPFTTSVSS